MQMSDLGLLAPANITSSPVEMAPVLMITARATAETTAQTVLTNWNATTVSAIW